MKIIGLIQTSLSLVLNIITYSALPIGINKN